MHRLVPWSAGCIINTSESKFSVHTGVIPGDGHEDSATHRLGNTL
jgi:hypothetical protein